uniref:WW domain binding protein VOPP1-like isoform X1 n=2 Tax=Myxine glutinosa TaxID=7769 RepID=UPI00358EA5DA
MRCCPPVTHSRRLLGSNMLTICMSHVACYSWRRLCRCHSMFAATSLLLASLAQLGHAKDCTFHDRNDRTLDFVCSEYEQCCGTKCCLRVISTYRIWYFWLCLLLGTLFCCGSGMWLKRRLLGTHGITAQPPLFVTRQADSGSRDAPLSGAYYYAGPVPFTGIQMPTYPFNSQPHRIPDYDTATASTNPAQQPNAYIGPTPSHSGWVSLYPPPPTYEDVVKETGQIH